MAKKHSSNGFLVREKKYKAITMCLLGMTRKIVGKRTKPELLYY